MYGVAAAQFTAVGTADMLIDQYIPLWGCPVTLISDNGLRFTASLSNAIYELLGTNKTSTSSYHPCTNGGVERVNHSMAQILAMGCNERNDNWDGVASERQISLQQLGQRSHRAGP